MEESCVHESEVRLGYLPAAQRRPIRARMLGTNFEKDYLEMFFMRNPISLQPHFPAVPASYGSDSRPAGHRTNIRPHKFPSAHCRVVHASANNKTKDSENYANALKVSNLRQLSLTKPSLDENGITTADEMNWLIAAAARSDADEKLTALKATEAKLMETNFPPDPDPFIVHVNVMPSGHFLGWIISLGKGVRIIKPEQVIRKMQVNLIKDLDKEFGKEATKVNLEGLGYVGYIANSPNAVQGESMSV